MINEEISRKLTGCNSFKACSWKVFCDAIELGRADERKKVLEVINRVFDNFPLCLEACKSRLKYNLEFELAEGKT